MVHKKKTDDCDLSDSAVCQKKNLIIMWADQIDEISELLIQHYYVAEKDEDYYLMEKLNEIIDGFESIDSKYIKYR